MANKEAFSIRLKQLRHEKGLTQKQLASELKISLPSIVHYENANRVPVSGVLSLMQQYFDVSKEYLLGETDKRLPANKWDDPELVQAVTDNISSLFCGVEQAVRGLSADEQKLVFDVLVEIRHVLGLKDDKKRKTTLSMLHDVTAAFEHLADGSEP